MATKKKLLQAAAGTAAASGGAGGLNIEDVFSTYLYTGNSSTQTITNGIDLAGEGGLVWIKDRTSASNQHSLNDTERGATKYLKSNSTDAEGTGDLTSFNSNGFSVRYQQTGYINENGMDLASWTFRKAPKFFDVQTWTGNGTAGRTISHNLGTTVGCVIIKNTSNAENWMVYHRGSTGTDGIDGQLNLNSTAAATDDSSQFNDTVPSSTVLTLGSNAEVNANGQTYVAYLFAHNDGDGDFGPTGDQDIIKCGSFTSTSGTDEIDLGFEPQWILIKRADAANSWVLVDEMRGNPVGSAANYLEPNGAFAESTLTGWTTPTPTGFTNSYPIAGGTFIYIAIRRGPMAVPTDATDVFAMDTWGGTVTAPPAWYSGFPVDMAFYRDIDSTYDWWNSSRLTAPNRLYLNATNAEASETQQKYDYMDGYYDGTGTLSDHQAWMWKRAPSFFDVVAYTGNGTAGRTVSHNLGVAPEMMWVKQRNATRDWSVFHTGIGNTDRLKLNLTDAATANNNWNYTDPTDTVFTLSHGAAVNSAGNTYIAYLFASLDGVSKVGSYTGDGTTDGSKVIDCGFSSGARFVLIKRTDGGGSWYVWDSERGIVAGNDPRLKLESTDAEDSFDNVDPHSSGFSVVGSSINNINGATYIFYAIA